MTRLITLLVLIVFYCAGTDAQTYSFVQLTDTYKDNKKVGDTQESSVVVDGNRFATVIYMHEIPIMANIIDYDSSTMTLITFAGESKSGMQKALPKPDSATVDVGNKPSISETAMRRTDETKEVDGYICRRYEMDATNGFYEMWMLEGYDLDFLGLQMKLMANMPATSTGGGAKGMPQMPMMPQKHGFPMEIYTEAKDKKNNATLMRVVKLKTEDVDLSIFDLEGVTLIGN